VKNLDRVAGQPFQIFLACQIWIQISRFPARFSMYSHV
jgi:hypothetical protein